MEIETLTFFELLSPQPKIQFVLLIQINYLFAGMCLTPTTHTFSPPRSPQRLRPCSSQHPQRQSSKTRSEQGLTLLFGKENKQLRNKDMALKIFPPGQARPAILKSPREPRICADLAWDGTHSRTTSYRPQVPTARIYSLPASCPVLPSISSQKNADFPPFPQPEPGSGMTQPVAWSISTGARRERWRRGGQLCL